MHGPWLQDGGVILLHSTVVVDGNLRAFRIIAIPRARKLRHEHLHIRTVLQNVPQRVRGGSRVLGLHPLGLLRLIAGIPCAILEECLLLVQEAPQSRPNLLGVAFLVVRAPMEGNKILPMAEFLLAPFAEELFGHVCIVPPKQVSQIMEVHGRVPLVVEQSIQSYLPEDLAPGAPLPGLHRGVETAHLLDEHLSAVPLDKNLEPLLGGRLHREALLRLGYGFHFLAQLVVLLLVGRQLGLEVRNDGLHHVRGQLSANTYFTRRHFQNPDRRWGGSSIL